MQAVHIMRNNMLSSLLEAQGSGFMPTMESRRGEAVISSNAGNHITIAWGGGLYDSPYMYNAYMSFTCISRLNCKSVV